MTTPAEDPLDAPTAALAAAVLEVARHVEGESLPRPRWFALARTADLLAASPSLASLLGDDGSSSDPLALAPIEMDEADGAPGGDGPSDPLEGLRGISWPSMAAGGALACDLAPEAWDVRGQAGALASGATLRVVIAAQADGLTWSALRQPEGEGYVMGAALVPDLTTALAQTVQELA